MLAKAVAHHTTASFIRVVGSEFVQKYLGEVGRQYQGWEGPADVLPMRGGLRACAAPGLCGAPTA